jgi:hypothetical protein
MGYKPFERFRVFPKDEPHMTAILLLSFLAYPSPERVPERQACADALQAWLIRRAYAEENIFLARGARLRRANLSPREVQSRVFKASKRIQFHALPVADIAYEVYWRNVGGYALVGKLVGAAFRAKSVQLTVPQNFRAETSVIRSYLEQTTSTRAQYDMRGMLENFRSRQWQEYLPAVPLLIALDRSVLGWDCIKGSYAAVIPGQPKRFLALSLARNPQIWVSSIIQWSTMWRRLLSPHFKADAFAQIFEEDDGNELRPDIRAMGAFFDGIMKPQLR